MENMRPTHLVCLVFGLLCTVVTTTAYALEELELKGQWQQGGIVFGKVAPGHEVKIADRLVRTTEAGDFVFGLAADAPPKFTLELIYPQGRVKQLTYEVKQRTYEVQHVNGVE